MSTTRLFVCLLIILPLGNRALAQDHIYNRVPSEMRDGITPTPGYTSSSTPSVSLPEAPTSRRVIDKKFVFVMAALGGAESLRFTSRKLVLEHEFAAGAPWVTSVPTNQHLVAKYAGIYASELFVSYEMKKAHSWLPGDRIIRKFWWAYPSAMAVIHIKNGVSNIRTQGPGGCTSIECAELMQ